MLTDDLVTRIAERSTEIVVGIENGAGQIEFDDGLGFADRGPNGIGIG